MYRKIIANRTFFSVLGEIILDHKKNLILLVFAIIFVTVINSILPRVFGELSKHIEDNNLSLQFFFVFIGIILIRIVFQSILSFQTTYTSKLFALRLKEYLIKLVVNAKQIVIDQYKTGDILQRVFTELGVLQGKLIFGLIYFIKDLLLLLVILVNIFLLSKMLFINLIVIAIIFYVYNQFLGLQIETSNEVTQKQQAKLSNYFLEVIIGKKDIFIFKLESRVKNKIRSYFQSIHTEHKKNSYLITYSETVLEILVGIFITSIIVIFLLEEHKTSHTIALLGYLLLMLWPIKEINSFMLTLNSILPSLNRVEDILIELKATTSSEPFTTPFTEIVKSDQLRLTVSDLHFSYEDKEIFNGFTYQFGTGIYLISGKNGSGKTTLGELLVGILTPQQGKIVIETLHDTNADIRDSIKLVSQEAFLFNDSVVNNIHTEDDMSIELIDEVASLYDRDNILEEKNSDIGEGGKLLSGGQKQLINILRGVLASPPILILDEITNNFSPVIYHHILQLIKEHRKDKITLVISHQKLDIDCNDIIEL